MEPRTHGAGNLSKPGVPSGKPDNSGLSKAFLNLPAVPYLFVHNMIPSPIPTMHVDTRGSAQTNRFNSLMLSVVRSSTPSSATLPYHNTLSKAITPPTRTSSSSLS